MIKPTEQYFSSTKIELCALLFHFGHKVEFIEKHGTQAEFFFLHSKDLQKINDGFWSKTPIEVIPVELFAALKHLKAMSESYKF